MKLRVSSREGVAALFHIFPVQIYPCPVDGLLHLSHVGIRYGTDATQEEAPKCVVERVLERYSTDLRLVKTDYGRK